MEEFENLGLNSTPELVPCSICGRTFRPETLERHQKICEKMQTKKRRVYDSSKKRAEGTEIKLPPKGKEIKVEKPKSNWREKHEEFINSIRAAKGDPEPLLEKDENIHADSSTSKPLKVPAGYVQCPHCGRNFNERAADRHVQWCKEQKSRISRSPASAEAVGRLKARTKYRAPKLNKKESATPTKPRAQKKTAKLETHATESQKLALSSANSLAESLKTTQLNNRINKPKPPERKNVPMRKVNITVSNQQPVNNASVAKIHPVIKFKEKFPNHKATGMMNGDNYESYQELIRTNNQFYSKTPRTVPGVRTGGQSVNGFDSVNNWTNVKSNENESNNNNLHLRFDELLGNQKNGNNKNSNWTKTSQGNGLPEVSSSDSPSQLKWMNDVDARISTGSSSSGSPLPPLSRGTSSDGRISRSCHQCQTRYPVSLAKYCYECGAKRVSAVVA